jgi:putative ubiquitin-RnfH superfamily antitoxin RatB of RatAB toxin-antitoxin module
MIEVEVVYPLATEQQVFTTLVQPGATVRDAIIRSGVLQRYPGLDADGCSTGIFGERVGLDAIVRPGDRVELYRALMADPKETRRRRAEKRKRGS